MFNRIYEFFIVALFLLLPAFLFSQAASTDTVSPYFEGSLASGIVGPSNIVYSSYLMYPLNFWNSTWQDGMSPAANVSTLPVDLSSVTEWQMNSAPSSSDFQRILRYHVFEGFPFSECSVQSPFFQSSSSYCTAPVDMRLNFGLRNYSDHTVSGRVRYTRIRGNMNGVYKELEFVSQPIPSEWYTFEVAPGEMEYFAAINVNSLIFYSDGQVLRNFLQTFESEFTAGSSSDVNLYFVWEPFFTLCPHSPVCHITTVMVNDPDSPMFGETVSYCDHHFTLEVSDVTPGSPSGGTDPDPDNPVPDFPPGGINGQGNTGTQNNTVNNGGGDNTNTYNQNGDIINNNTVNNYFQTKKLEQLAQDELEYTEGIATGVSGIASAFTGEYTQSESMPNSGFFGTSAETQIADNAQFIHDSINHFASDTVDGFGLVDEFLRVPNFSSGFDNPFVFSLPLPSGQSYTFTLFPVPAPVGSPFVFFRNNCRPAIMFIVYLIFTSYMIEYIPKVYNFVFGGK